MTMEPIAVFAGPSLPASVRPPDPAVDWRPPASAGDLLRLLPDPPRTVCLIDGYFDHRPAVWHKEILLLMEHGVRVLGAASMGALRAAELDRHGMIGVGAIYRAYRSGRLHGDDEVALVHALGEKGWTPVSEPMVEVRATLNAAVRCRIIAPAVAHSLRYAALAIHFSERDWPAIMTSANLGPTDMGRLSFWLRSGIVRLKRRDALHCLAEARVVSRAPMARVATPRTCFLDELAAECRIPNQALSSSVQSGERMPDHLHERGSRI